MAPEWLKPGLHTAGAYPHCNNVNRATDDSFHPYTERTCGYSALSAWTGFTRVARSTGMAIAAKATKIIAPTETAT